MSDAIEKQIRVALKPHKCTGCFGKIKQGERYVFMEWVDDCWFKAKLCRKCYYALCELLEQDEWGDGDLAEYHEGVPEGYEIPVPERRKRK